MNSTNSSQAFAYNQLARALKNSSSRTEKDTIKRYFENKTIGYDGNGKLQKAFSI